MVRSVVAAAVTVASLVLLAVQFASMRVDSGVLPTVVPENPCGVLLADVDRGSGVAALHDGDVVDISKLAPRARTFLATGSVAAGAPLVLPVIREGRSVVVALPTLPQRPWTFWLVAILSKIVVYGVGALVLWRGRDAAAFFFGIASVAVAIAVHPEASAALPPGVQIAYTIVVRLCADVAAVFLYLMVERLAWQALAARWITAARTAVFSGVAIDVASTVAYVRALADGQCVAPAIAAGVRLGFILALLATLAVLAAAYVTSTGVARQRLKWIVLSTALGFSGVLVYLAAPLGGRPIPSYPIMNLTMVAIPVGYSYAILRHRVIDVGFAINRAIVFAALTTLVVLAFALLSSAIERMAVGPGTGVALQVAVALALALSFNALQKRVEAAIDRIFFRRKHAAEAALARLADEAPFVRSIDVLLDRSAQTVHAQLGASGVAIYLARHEDDYRLVAAVGGDAYAETLAIDDPLFVRLRTYLGETDSDAVRSDLGNAYVAFALAARGRLIGALVCGHRANGEDYDPDERSALRGLAARLASVLESLRAREYARLVKAIADGDLSADGAMRRAKELLAAE